jgi:hypothetical protein
VTFRFLYQGLADPLPVTPFSWFAQAIEPVRLPTALVAGTVIAPLTFVIPTAVPDVSSWMPPPEVPVRMPVSLVDPAQFAPQSFIYPDADVPDVCEWMPQAEIPVRRPAELVQGTTLAWYSEIILVVVPDFFGAQLSEPVLQEPPRPYGSMVEPLTFEVTALERLQTGTMMKVLELSEGDYLEVFVKRIEGTSGSVYLARGGSGLTIIGPIG